VLLSTAHTSESVFARLTLDIALRSRELHGVGVDGCCLYCPGKVRWPCAPFENAHGTIKALSCPPLPRREPGEALAAVLGDA
jgi:hypothetical protein